MNTLKFAVLLIVLTFVGYIAIERVGQLHDPNFDLAVLIQAYPKLIFGLVLGLVLAWMLLFEDGRGDKILVLVCTVGIAYSFGVLRQDLTETADVFFKKQFDKVQPNKSADGSGSVATESEEVDITPIETTPEDRSKYPTIAPRMSNLDRAVFKLSGEDIDIAFLLIATKEWGLLASKSLLKELQEYRKANPLVSEDYLSKEVHQRVREVLAGHYLKVGTDFAGITKVQVMYDRADHHAELAKIRALIKSASTE